MSQGPVHQIPFLLFRPGILGPEYPEKKALSHSLIKSGANSSKGKHIGTNYHYIQDIVEKGEIRVRFIPLNEMLADSMTKGLTLDRFRVHVGNMGLVDPKT